MYTLYRLHFQFISGARSTQLRVRAWQVVSKLAVPAAASASSVVVSVSESVSLVVAAEGAGVARASSLVASS